jgi:hypothetical protein
METTDGLEDEKESCTPLNQTLSFHYRVKNLPVRSGASCGLWKLLFYHRLRRYPREIVWLPVLAYCAWFAR